MTKIKTKHKLSAVFLACMIAFTFMPMIDGNATAAAAKPAKVKTLKPAKTSISVTLKWKKAKNAKKYEVHQLKSKKFKKIKTTKKTKLTVKKLTPKTSYKFKVRGVNGKKKGKFSKVIKVKTPMGKVHSGVVDPAKAKVVVGDTYRVKKGEESVKLTITDYTTLEGGHEFRAKTENGGNYTYIIMDKNEGWSIEEPGYANHFEHETGSAVADGTTSILKIKDNNTAAYWTLDGVEPKIGQEDKTGYSKHCRKNILDNWTWEEVDPNVRALFESYGYNKSNHQIRTKLRGTAFKTTEIWKEPHEDLYEARWIKAYHNGKLIYEWMNIYNK